MAIDAKAILDEFVNGLAPMSAMDGTFMGNFMALDGSAGKFSLDDKTRELVCVGLAIEKRCKYCICVHVNGAYAAGATREEIMGAAEMAIAMGGGPSVAYSATVLQAALDAFEPEK